MSRRFLKACGVLAVITFASYYIFKIDETIPPTEPVVSSLATQFKSYQQKIDPLRVANNGTMLTIKASKKAENIKTRRLASKNLENKEMLSFLDKKTDGYQYSTTVFGAYPNVSLNDKHDLLGDYNGLQIFKLNKASQEEIIFPIVKHPDSKKVGFYMGKIIITKQGIANSMDKLLEIVGNKKALQQLNSDVVIVSSTSMDEALSFLHRLRSSIDGASVDLDILQNRTRVK
jgi:hypothetical protein